ncbi:MAG: hypothetical protein IMY70_01975 [Bacteroidetes bacterium]|nr:hypothetical protein [Bacteroidota bacterium]
MFSAILSFSQSSTDYSLQRNKNASPQNINDTLRKSQAGDSLAQVPEHLQKMVDALAGEIEAKDEDEIGLEIDGLVMKETRTKMGNDFYDYFYKNWEAPPNARNYSIVIKELPYRLTLTLIVVSINNNEIFRSALQPRKEIIIALADYALIRAEEFLINYEDIMKQLGGEDQAGTGIF